ncbi:MAG: hypothetical protein SWE60_16260 [Thermodesulfobacteriota bacterium]|nr:hypothetical protein [Thermodesulfobacteriota bacterium]
MITPFLLQRDGVLYSWGSGSRWGSTHDALFAQGPGVKVNTEEDGVRLVLGIICILFGGIGWMGQVLSGVHYSLAQRLGLQEKSEGTDPLFRRAETYTARWDALVLWTLLLAGVLMLTDNYWWPYLGLIAGGIYLDAAGREGAKYIGLSKSGIRIGTPKDLKIAACCFLAMGVVSLWVIVYATWTLAERVN